MGCLLKRDASGAPQHGHQASDHVLVDGHHDANEGAGECCLAPVEPDESTHSQQPLLRRWGCFARRRRGCGLIGLIILSSLVAITGWPGGLEAPPVDGHGGKEGHAKEGEADVRLDVGGRRLLDAVATHAVVRDSAVLSIGEPRLPERPTGEDDEGRARSQQGEADREREMGRPCAPRHPRFALRRGPRPASGASLMLLAGPGCLLCVVTRARPGPEEAVKDDGERDEDDKHKNEHDPN
eukprot:5726976-Prymnesium_polylepis.1